MDWKNFQMWSVLFLIHCIRSDCKRCRFDLRLIRIWYLYVTQPIGRFSNIISKTKYQRVQLLWEQWNLKYQQAFLCFTKNLYSWFEHEHEHLKWKPNIFVILTLPLICRYLQTEWQKKTWETLAQFVTKFVKLRSQTLVTARHRPHRY